MDPNGLAASLKACAGEGDPVSAAAKAAALAFSAFPDAPAAEAEILALWVFDMVIAIRLRWARPLPLIATKILDPGLRSDGAGRRPRPGEPAWSNTAAGAIALAAASALDLAADLSRRSETLIAVAPKLRSKPAAENRRPPARPRLRLARRSGPPGADDRPRRPPAVRPAGRAWRRARVFGAAHVPAVRPMTAAARRRRRDSEDVLDVELVDLPPAARWREWMLRVEAAIFASQKPVPREALVRLVGETCRFDDLIADLIHELRGRPYDLALVAGGYALRTKTRFAPAIRAAHPGLGTGRRCGIDPDGDLCPDGDRLSAAGHAGGDFQAGGPGDQPRHHRRPQAPRPDRRRHPRASARRALRLCDDADNSWRRSASPRFASCRTSSGSRWRGYCKRGGVKEKWTVPSGSGISSMTTTSFRPMPSWIRRKRSESAGSRERIDPDVLFTENR